MLQVYRERTSVDVVAESDNLSVGRLRLYVQVRLPNWKDTAAAGFVWNDPTQYESKTSISENALRCVVEAMSVDIDTLLRDASAWWRSYDDEKRSK